jgi:hypothetical protein
VLPFGQSYILPGPPEGCLQPCCPYTGFLIWVNDSCSTCFLFALFLGACTILICALLPRPSYTIHLTVSCHLASFAQALGLPLSLPLSTFTVMVATFVRFSLAPSTCIGLTRLYLSICFGIFIAAVIVIFCPCPGFHTLADSPLLRIVLTEEQRFFSTFVFMFQFPCPFQIPFSCLISCDGHSYS